MTPEEFIEKWRNVETTERAAAQAHFIDLCRLLDEATPQEADPRGKDYAFEKRVTKPGGRGGFADVWKRKRFAWEYKGDSKNLVAAYSQLKEYADALENPPLLIVSDMKEIRIHTNFTDAVAEVHRITLQDLMGPQARQKLKWAFTNPEHLRPTATRELVTTKAAAAFAAIAQKLRSDGYEPQRVAHFLNKLVFCLFVEDIELLPDRVFADILEESVKSPEAFAGMLGDLFRAMSKDHSRFGKWSIPWFNGGLFDDDDVLPLGFLEIRDLADASRLDWSQIEPSIFGTWFEKGLDPNRRKEMASLFDLKPSNGSGGVRALPGLESPVTNKGVGIHYTDPDTIMKLIEPVVLRPLKAEWDACKRAIAEKRAVGAKGKSGAAKTRAENEARDIYKRFRERLGRFRVLDPACGSGNFLYLALSHLKNFDVDVIAEATKLRLPLDNQRVTPELVRGIEINPYAAELARVTIWIGELQWQLRKGFRVDRKPILGQLRGIECRDALINPDGSEAKWPRADAIVGNPPFLGDKLMKDRLGSDYVERLRSVYEGRVPGGGDLVCFWFAKAGEEVANKVVQHAGLVATNSIRGGANRRVLDKIVSTSPVYDAWDDERWVIDGAAVRVSLVAFALQNQYATHTERPHLDGEAVEEIFANLTARRGGKGADLTKAVELPENKGTAFNGIQKTGPFEVDGLTARLWLQLPLNPNERTNSDVLHPYWNGIDLTRRQRDSWIVDFGATMSEAEASMYEAPFAYALKHVKPVRAKNSLEPLRKLWWRHWRPRPEMIEKISRLERFIVTPEVSKYRLFAWLRAPVGADKNLIVIARGDDTSFGILHSKHHKFWALRMGTSLEDRPRYTPSSTFETFPFPDGMRPNLPAKSYAKDPKAAAVAAAAKQLNQLRENWLNPSDLVARVPEVVQGYPDRIVAVSDRAAEQLKKRTLTNLYNENPTWLQNAHRALDEAVAAAYGWPADLPDDEILKRLLDLNLARAARQ